MPLDFPSAPTNGQQYTYNGRTWEYNGTAWQLVSPQLQTGGIADGAVTSAKIADDTIVNADINTAAAIAHSKLAAISAGQVLLGNASNVPTATGLTGDVTVNSSGVTSIGSGVIVNADVNASAAIAGTKISPDFGTQIVQSDGNGRFGGSSPYTEIGSRWIEVGAGNSNNDTFIDFQDAAASGGSDYAGRIIRAAGSAGSLSISQRGAAGALLRLITEANLPITFTTDNIERMRVGGSGSIYLNASQNLNATPGLGDTDAGVVYEFPGGAFFISRSGSTALFVNRSTNTGGLVEFNYNGNTQGNISINGDGTTVSYNTFTGAHWGRLEDNSTPEILPGTVMESTNTPITWKYLEFEGQNNEGQLATLKMPWTGPETDGTPVEFEYNGVTVIGLTREEDAGAVNKHVCVKVSDVPGSKAVFGVFMGWDLNSANSVVVGSWPDMNVAALGNYFVRMDAGEDPQIGDYVESAGNGCARVQADDILRASTVAKVTSTNVQETYPDGSFLVTATIHCG